MERPSGLGRSLEDVLDSFAPTDPDPSAPSRVLFEPENIQQQLDSLMDEIRGLHVRVQHLVALVPGNPDTYARDLEASEPKKGKKGKKAKHPGEKQSGKRAKKQGKGAKKAGKVKRDKGGTKARPQRAAA